jgi:glycosyltransferase involved in cell wall biosynthesis
VPLIFRGDSHFLGRGAPTLARRFLLRVLYAQFAAFLTVGAANRDYFTVLGVPAAKLFSAPHAVNDALFDPAASAQREAAVALRQQLGLSSTTRVVLFAGKLVPAKQPRELLEAFLALRPAHAALCFVGDGSEKPALLERVRAHGPAGVHFLPFANQSEMPPRLLLADVFALPSRGHYETWGLAINEAMHMGVPALVSDLVGCHPDLVTEGETGWVFHASDPDSLREKLAVALKAVADDSARERFRDRVRARIAGYTYEQTTAGLLAALESIDGGKNRHRSEP